MLSQTVREAVNQRLTLEMYAANVYLTMAAYCDSINLPGFGHWLRVQFMEEIRHGMRVYKFLETRNGQMPVSRIANTRLEFAGPADVFEKAHAHEQMVARSYQDLHEIVVHERDYTAQQMVSWFLREKAEGERTTRRLAERARAAENDPTALLELDQELANRREERMAA